MTDIQLYVASEATLPRFAKICASLRSDMKLLTGKVYELMGQY